MTSTLSSFVMEHPVFDVHEHHLPEVYLNPDVGLLDLFKQSYAGWTQERPYPLPSEVKLEAPMVVSGKTVEWAMLRPFLEHSGSNSFVRNLLRGLSDLYDLGPEGLHEGNWKKVDEQVRERHRSPQWPSEVLNRARIQKVITDPYTDPLLNGRSAFGENYRSVMRINGFAMSPHPDTCDHNGQSGFRLADRLGFSCDSFDDYCAFLEHTVDTMPARGQVGLKNALAYDRDICFQAPDEMKARRAWRNPQASEEDCVAFGDFVVDRFCRLAGERDLPMQMHLGTALIGGSHPLKAVDLVERHPNTRFLLMHLAYPWSSDLLAMAFVHRNIWIDLTWSFLLSPSHFKRAFHEAIEILPDESRMMLGGDNWHVEETYATVQTARRLIAEVLEEKVRVGYFTSSDAERLATKILYQNARDFFQSEEG